MKKTRFSDPSLKLTHSLTHSNLHFHFLSLNPSFNPP